MTNMEMIPIYFNAISSAFFDATFFGVISPNTSIRNVKTPVATPTRLLPNIFSVSVVDSAEAERFTILFPIKIAESILSVFAVISKTFSALLSPFSAKFLILNLFEVMRAVSADEKNAEADNNNTKMTNCNMSLVSKISPIIELLFFGYYIRQYFFCFFLYSERHYQTAKQYKYISQIKDHLIGALNLYAYIIHHIASCKSVKDIAE